MPNRPEQSTPPEAEGEISLRDFLTYNNPNRARYQEIIKREHDRFRVGLPQDFADNWSMVYFDGQYEEGEKGNERYYPSSWEKLRAYFKEKLQGGNLIDVGGGGQDFMAELAKKSGAKKYINVDIGCPRFEDEPVGSYLTRLNPHVGRPKKVDFWHLPENERTLPMETISVNADMLDFISRLPDNSSNFAVNGIDSNIIYDNEYYIGLGLKSSSALLVSEV